MIGISPSSTGILSHTGTKKTLLLGRPVRALFPPELLAEKVTRQEQRRIREGGRKFSQSPNEALDLTLRQAG